MIIIADKVRTATVLCTVWCKQRLLM